MVSKMSEEKKAGPWLRKVINDTAQEFDLELNKLVYEISYSYGTEMNIYYAGRPYGSVTLGESQGETYTERAREQIEEDIRKIFKRIAEEIRPPAEQRIVALLVQILEKLDEIREELEV